MMQRIKKIHKDDIVDILPIIIVFVIIGIIIGTAIYGAVNTDYEISYTTGTVINKYEEEYDTHNYIRDEDGNIIRIETHHHHDYYTSVKVKDTDNYATLCQREYYEHHKIGDNVKVKVSMRYFKGKYKDTSYFVVY